MAVQIKDSFEKSIPEKYSESFLLKVENEVYSIEKSIKIIQNKNEFPWVIDKLNEKMRLKYEPAFDKSTFLLQFCTKESIIRNYDNLFNYYHQIHSFMKETAEQQIYELLNHEKIEAYDPDLYKKELLVTFWHDNKEHALTHETDRSSYDEHLSSGDFQRLPREHQVLWEIPKNKSGYYCLYFSENHSIQDLEWFLENRLNKVIKSGSELKKFRPNTLALRKRALIGYLTILGVKPQDLTDLYNYFSSKNEAVTYYEVNKIKGRFVKDKHFKIASKEFERIRSKRETTEIINKYLADTYAGLLDSNGDVRSVDNIKIAPIPRFLELKCIKEDEEPYFHLQLTK